MAMFVRVDSSYVLYVICCSYNIYAQLQVNSVMSALGEHHVLVPNVLSMGVSDVHRSVEVVSVVYPPDSICGHG